MIFVFIIFEITISTLSLNMDGNKQTEDIYKFLKIIEFMTVPCIPTILASLVARKHFWNKVRKYFIILIVINILCQLITFFIPFMFVIDESATYTRTVFSIIYISIVIICFMLLMLCSYKTFIQNTIGISLTLIAINVFILAGFLIRSFNVKSNSDWLCMTFGYFLFLLDFGNSFLKIDPATSLLNRRAFTNKLASIRYSTALIIIDANNFKKINDTYGHHCGDWALTKIAETIFSIYSNIGYCYRIGGDEFCVILKPHMLKKLTYETENLDCYAMLGNLMKRLDDIIEELSKKHKKLQYGVSQGFGIYYSIAESSDFKQYKSIEQVFQIADERMYKEKEKRKKAQGSLN